MQQTKPLAMSSESVVIPQRQLFAVRNLLLADAVELPARSRFLPFGVGMTTLLGRGKKDLPPSTPRGRKERGEDLDYKIWAALAGGPVYYDDDGLSLVVVVRLGTVHLRVCIRNRFVVG